MTVGLLYITNNVEVGRIAERAGVDWIFVDLEYRGKSTRQAGRDTVVSEHTLDDVAAMRAAITRSKLLVRINPIGPWSASEIDAVIKRGADIVMLPFFTCADEVGEFVARVAGRAMTWLLVETPQAVRDIDEILDVPGVDFVHIGLNDLHIARGTRFMFEFLADGSLDKLCAILRSRGVPFGFGGMARIGEKVPPAEAILAEHYRLGSSAVILSRAFCPGASIADIREIERLFDTGVRDIRACEAHLAKQSAAFFEANRLRVRDQIYEVANQISPAPATPTVAAPFSGRFNSDRVFRGMDILLAIAMLFPALLVCLVVVPLLRFSGEGDVFYRQIRRGRFNKPFKLLKFATMVRNSPNLGSGEITLPGDPRVLPVGRFLRKTKINELPQLINILRGELSFIGPRPQTQQYFGLYPITVQQTLSSVRPGMSGIGSILFRDEEGMLGRVDDPIDFDRRVIIPYKGILECWYVKHRSIRLYLELLLATLLVVIFPRRRFRWLLRNIPTPPAELEHLL